MRSTDRQLFTHCNHVLAVSQYPPNTRCPDQNRASCGIQSWKFNQS
uniref:Bm14172 n=1 Tax=Brugia malayi TaxID=6279 RepID=A0A1I9G1F7_BRUMA|nr:Bm14172 [Brugia malayi]